MSLGKRLIQLRKRKSMTQDELANALQVSRGAVSMWEIDQRTPDPPTLQRIAKFHGVTVDYLLEGGSSHKASNPSWWNNDTPPTDVELESFLHQANVHFNGAPLNDDDKEDILTYLRVKWEREKKKQERKNGQ